MKVITESFKWVAVTAIAICAVYSCSDFEEETLQVPSTQSIKAHQDAENGTRAIYDGTYIQWSEGDAISIFPSGSSSNLRFVKEEGESNSFIGDGSVNLASSFAMYPYNAGATMANGSITTSILTTQTATAGSFAPDANVAVGYSADGKDVFFKNAVSYIKVNYKTTVANPDIKKITFKSLDSSVKITGPVTLTPTVSGGSISDITTAVGEQGVDYAELTGTIEPDTDYYIAIAPVTLAEGYEIIFTDGNGNEFSKEYTAENNKAELSRNTISSVGKKNLDNYEIGVEAYWRVKSAEEFTGNNDKYLIVKNTTASSTGYRIFDESKTDVFMGSGTPLVDKFAIAGYSSMGSLAKLSALSNYKTKLTSWQDGGSCPAMMSHFVLYCFRQAYSDNGLDFGPLAQNLVFNPEDTYSFIVNSDETLRKTTSFKLCYKYSGSKSMNVDLTNCYLEAGADNSFKLCGRITQQTIDELVNVFFLGKGSNFTSAITSSDIHEGADRAINEDTKVGFCGQEVTTADGTKMSNCFMIKNSKLCNTPEQESIWIYKKCIKPMSFVDYMSL